MLQWNVFLIFVTKTAGLSLIYIVTKTVSTGWFFRTTQNEYHWHGNVHYVSLPLHKSHKWWLNSACARAIHLRDAAFLITVTFKSLNLCHLLYLLLGIKQDLFFAKPKILLFVESEKSFKFHSVWSFWYFGKNITTSFGGGCFNSSSATLLSIKAEFFTQTWNFNFILEDLSVILLSSFLFTSFIPNIVIYSLYLRFCLSWLMISKKERTWCWRYPTYISRNLCLRVYNLSR